MEIWNIMSNLNKCIFEGWFTQQTEKSCHFYEEEGQYPMMIYYCDSRLLLCFLHCVFTYWIFTFGKFQFLNLYLNLYIVTKLIILRYKWIK